MEWWTQAGEEWKPVWINCEAELVMDVPATRGAPDTDYPFEDRQKVQTKFIIITHNRMTMSRVDRLYGVTMPEKGISQLVAVDLQKAESMVA